MAKLTPPYGQDPCPRGYESHNLCNGVGGHHDHALSFIQIYMGVKQIF